MTVPPRKHKHHDGVYQQPERLRAKKSGFTTPVIVHKPWGQEELVILTDRYVAKILTINSGHRLSVQYHNHKCETLRCLSGSGWAHLGTKRAPKKLLRRPFEKGMILHITPGTVHTYEAKTRLRLFEVSTPEVWDVVRLHDNYGRTTPTRTTPAKSAKKRADR